MELCLTLPQEKLNKLKALTHEPLIYCIPFDITSEGVFGDDCYLCVTQSGIYIFEGNEVKSFLLAKVEKAFSRTQQSGAILTLKINGEEFPAARCSLRHISRLASVARGINLLIKGITEKKVTNNEREKYCPKCGRILPGTATCPKCDKKNGNLKRLLELCRENKKVLSVIFILMLFDSAIAIYKEQVLKVFMDEHLVSKSGTAGDVLLFFCTYLGIILIGLAVFYLKAYLCGRLGARVAHGLRRRLSEHLQKMSLSFLSGRSTGEVVERVMGDTARVRDFISNSFCATFNQVFYLIAIIIILFIMNWKLAILTLLFMPVVIIFTKTFWPKIHRIFRNLWRKQDGVQNKLQDVLSGIRIVKTYGREKAEVDEFCNVNEKLARINYKNERFFAIFYPIITLTLTFSTYIIIYFGGLDVLDGSMTPGELMQFVAYAGMLLGPLSWMTHLPRQIVNMSTSLERIYDILDEKPQIASANDAVNTDIKGNITVKDVVFGYHTHEPVLDGVSLDVKAGEMIGLVGSSGSGKSTFINLIMRLYDVDEGAILVDGRDIRELDVAGYHSQIGVVLQETFLFAGSVLDNIRFAKPQATGEEIILAAKAANAHDFICKLPDGYNTYVGEKGHNLSGGEKQRIAIARAILNDPKILILDEATSALDTESEYQVQQALERLRQNRTTFAIAHRLSTLRCADRIAVIDDHKIAEVGTHNELLKKKGIYYSLVMAQLQMNKTAEEKV